MTETPHPTLFDRNEAQVVAQLHLAPQLELLIDLANYGSNLLARTFGSSQKQISDLVICGVLLKQLITMVDAIEVLLRSGCGPAAQLQGRAVLEVSITIDWMLLRDSKYRASCFMVSNYRAERNWALRAIHGTAENSEFNERTQAQYEISEEITGNGDAMRARVQEIDDLLSQPELKRVNEEFERLRKKNKFSFDSEWHEAAGTKSIRQMAKDVGRSAEYDVFYAIGSNSVHGKSYKEHLAIHSDQVHFKPIRHLSKADILIRTVVSTTLGTYRKLLETYRPDELPTFANKYKSDWQTAFNNITCMNYQF